MLGETVERYRRVAPKLAEWMEENVPEGLMVFAFPEGALAIAADDEWTGAAEPGDQAADAGGAVVSERGVVFAAGDGGGDGDQ